MLSGALLVVAAFAAVAALIRAVSGLRAPGELLSSCLLVLLGMTCFVLSRYLSPGGGPGGGPGGSVAALLTDTAMMTAVFAVLALLVFVSQPPADARPRAAHRLAALAACAGGMVICFAVGPVPGPAADGTLLLLGYFTLYAVFLGSSLAEIASLAWRQSGPAAHRPFRHAGMLLVCVGAVAGLTGLAGQTALAAIGAAHLAAPPLAGAVACPGITTSSRCAFAAALPAAAVVLTTAGATLPVLAAAAAAARRYWRHLLMYRALEPLWDRLRSAFPQITLPEHDGRSRLSLTFRLYRRVIEIDDGCILLRPYMRSGVAAAAEPVAAGFGLRGDALRATVEAAGIVAALRAYRTAGLHDAPAPDHSGANVQDLDEQAAWLTKVSRAYATSPLVYQLVTRHR